MARAHRPSVLRPLGAAYRSSNPRKGGRPIPNDEVGHHECSIQHSESSSSPRADVSAGLGRQGRAHLPCTPLVGTFGRRVPAIEPFLFPRQVAIGHLPRAGRSRGNPSLSRISGPTLVENFERGCGRAPFVCPIPLTRAGPPRSELALRSCSSISSARSYFAWTSSRGGRRHGVSHG